MAKSGIEWCSDSSRRFIPNFDSVHGFRGVLAWVLSSVTMYCLFLYFVFALTLFYYCSSFLFLFLFWNIQRYRQWCRNACRMTSQRISFLNEILLPSAQIGERVIFRQKHHMLLHFRGSINLKEYGAYEKCRQTRLACGVSNLGEWNRSDKRGKRFFLC